VETGRQDWMDYGLIGKTQLKYFDDQEALQAQQNIFEKTGNAEAYRQASMERHQTEMKLQALYTVLDSIQGHGSVVTADMISKDTYKICKEQYGISEKELKSLVKDAQEGKVPELEYNKQEDNQTAPFRLTTVEEKVTRVRGNHFHSEKHSHQKVLLSKKSDELEESGEIIIQSSFKMKQKAEKKSARMVGILSDVLKNIRRTEKTPVTQAVKIPKAQVGMFKKKLGMSEKELEQLSLELQSELAPVVQEELNREKEQAERQREAAIQQTGVQQQIEPVSEENLSIRDQLFNRRMVSERYRALQNRYNTGRETLKQRMKNKHTVPVEDDARTIDDLTAQIEEKSNRYFGIAPKALVEKHNTMISNKQLQIRTMERQHKKLKETFDEAPFLLSIVSTEHLKMMNDYVKMVESCEKSAANQSKMMLKEGVKSPEAYEKKLEKEIANALKEEARKRGTKEPIAMNSTEALSKLSIKKTVWEQEKEKIRAQQDEIQRMQADMKAEISNLPEGNEKDILSKWEEGNGICIRYKEFGLKTERVDAYIKGIDLIQQEKSDLAQMELTAQDELSSYQKIRDDMPEAERARLKTEIEQLINLKWQKETAYNAEETELYIQNRCESLQVIKEIVRDMIAELDQKLEQHPELNEKIQKQKQELNEWIFKQELEIYEGIRSWEYAHERLHVQRNAQNETMIQTKAKEEWELLLAQKESEWNLNKEIDAYIKNKEIDANIKNEKVVEQLTKSKDAIAKAYKSKLEEIQGKYDRTVITYDLHTNSYAQQKITPVTNTAWAGTVKKVAEIRDNEEAQSRNFVIYDVELGKAKLEHPENYIAFMRTRYQNRTQQQV